MSRWEAWLLHILTIVVTVTGIAYFWMKYMMEVDDPLSVINHPWQPTMINLHILASPLLVFTIGLIVPSHVITKLRHKVKGNRCSGLLALFSFPLMALSGYLLQIITHEFASRVLLILHLVTGITFAISYLIHQVLTFRLWVKQLRQRKNYPLAA